MAIEMSWRLGCPPFGWVVATKATDTTSFCQDHVESRVFSWLAYYWTFIDGAWDSQLLK